MKRAIIISLIVLFCVTIFIFSIFGSEFREILAARVTTTTPTETYYGLSIPASAIHTNPDTGTSYVFIAERTDKYPEKGYVAKYVECNYSEVTDEIASEIDKISKSDVLIDWLSALTSKSIVIVDSDKKLVDGHMVIINK